MVDDRLAVLVHSGTLVSSEFTLCWKEHRIKVWAEEIPGKWTSGFLNEVDPVGGAPVMSPEVEVSSEFDSESVNLKSHDGCSPSTCMGKPQDLLSPSPEEKEPNLVNNVDPCTPGVVSKGEREYVQRSPVEVNSGDQVLSDKVFKLETKFMGPDDQIENLEDNVGSGKFDSLLESHEANRPSYITTRPNRKCKSKLKEVVKDGVAHSVDIPDLNKVVNSLGDSDPFNINEIFRLEKEEARNDAINRVKPNPSVSEEGSPGEGIDKDSFKDEVAQTIDFGSRLGSKCWVSRIK
ncbi:hypothetical protein Hanom_Chr03g00179891 [Helianthus anomalus]